MRVHSELIHHYLQLPYKYRLPLDLKSLILAFSAHIRTGHKSVAYILFVP